MLFKIKLWLLKYLVGDLKQHFFTGKIDVSQVLTERELVDFVKSQTRRRSWVKEVHEINVKKGQRKYTLLIIDTLDGQFKVNLGRHDSENPRFYSLKKAA